MADPVTPDAGPPPALLGPADAARYLGLGRSTLDTKAAAGRVPAPVKLGGKVLYCRAELDAWVLHKCPPRAEWAPVWYALRTAAVRTGRPHS